MNNSALQLFIMNSHQVFFGLLATLYAGMALYDVASMKESSTLDKRRFMAPILIVMFAGLAINFGVDLDREGLFFAIEFALFAVLGLVHPKYSVGFFVFLLLTRPWESFDSSLMESMPRDFFYVAILSLISYKVSKKDYSINFNLGAALCGFFAIWVFFSAFKSPFFSEALNSYVEVFMKGVIIFFLVQNSFDDAKDLLAVKAALVLSILEMGLISFNNTMAKGAGTIAGDEFQRLEAIGILSNSNDIAAILVLALPFCFFFFLRKNIRGVLWPLSILSFSLIGFLVWASQSRGALLALFISISAYFVTKINSKKIMALILIAGALGAVGTFSLLKRKGADLDGSTNNRIIYWMAGANMAARNPLFGVGFWGFNKNFSTYAVGGDTGTEGKEMTAHSAWVQVMAETGYIGFFAFVALWGYAAYRSWLVRKSDPEYFTSIMGYGAAITFLSHAYQLYPYILLSLAISRSFLPEREEAVSPMPASLNYQEAV